MSEVPSNEEKILIARSGGKCAFPGCNRVLVTESPQDHQPVFTGRVCHIVARSRQGPRGIAQLSDEDRNRHPNLVLLCQDHHDVVDKRPRTYSVRVLRAIKVDHELKVAGATRTALETPYELRREKLQSTCLPVIQIPGQVFSAPCSFKLGDEKEIRARRDFSRYEGKTPFFLAEGRLHSFCDLRRDDNPFAKVIDRTSVESVSVDDLKKSKEGSNRIVRLINMSFRQHLGPKNVSYDGEHKRFYFRPLTPGCSRIEEYRTVGNQRGQRNVVWQPTRRSTGEPRKYWYHLAAGINFQHVGEESWVVTVRPERHLTLDGETPYAPNIVGRKVTSLKAHMYNAGYLSEVHFWRTYLSEGKPHIQFSYGHQHLIIDSTLIAYEVDWPGVDNDAIAFKAQRFEGDLFDFFERKGATEDEFEDAAED